MNESTDIGLNRTGIQTSPLLSKELIEGARDSKPSSPGDASLIAQIRVERAKESERVGKMPPPVNLKGLASTAIEALKGEKATVLLDKIAARLAYERTGVRLYEALISKFDAYGNWPGGPTREQLEEIRTEELRHFGLLTRALEMLGADPTALTPGADLEATLSMGFPQVLSDPRTTLRECIRAIVAVELLDNDSWDLLVRLAKAHGQKQLVQQFTEALEREQVHLAQVKSWTEASVSMESGAALPASTPSPVA
jgi:rubrerythrin